MITVKLTVQELKNIRESLCECNVDRKDYYFGSGFGMAQFRRKEAIEFLSAKINSAFEKPYDFTEDAFDKFDRENPTLEPTLAQKLQAQHNYEKRKFLRSFNYDDVDYDDVDCDDEYNWAEDPDMGSR